jgi:hypothetical protein
MNVSDILKPVRYFAYFFMGAGILGIGMHLYLVGDIKYTYDFQIFVLILSALHFSLGLGLILRNKWAYFVFRYYVLLLYVGFPFGTYLSKKMTKYLETNDIKRFFG